MATAWLSPMRIFPLRQRAADEACDPPMIVDAHHHVWRLARDDYDWLTPDLPIHRD